MSRIPSALLVCHADPYKTYITKKNNSETYIIREMNNFEI